MNWMENILIIGGISLDIFAAMELEGAMLANIKRKTLLITCTLVTILQMIFFFGGYFVCYEIDKHEVIANASFVGYVIAVFVFAFLGIRLLIKAVRREMIQERCRESLRVRDYVKIIAQTSVYTLIAGCACGFVGTSVVMMAIVILIFSILVVVGGLYTGYHFGVDARSVTYAIGAVLLWIAGIEILLRNVLYVIA